MEDIQIIEKLISEEKYAEALQKLSGMIDQQPESANLRYMRGKLYWKLGQRGKAITDYEYAAALDPQSPARNALNMANEIMGYFNPDLFNP